jgi:hypothetical protein
MYEEPTEDPTERTADPAVRAKEKSDEFRTHAELAAVFEAPRKFGARLVPGLDAELTREIQRTVGKLDKARSPESPILPPTSVDDAAGLLKLGEARGLSLGDYHIHRRPGEAMIVRWLAGDGVDTFYDRFQAHFDAALTGFREDERQALEWKQEPATLKYLEALDAIDAKMADRYLREPIKQHNLFVLSTQAADEMNIAYLSDHIMGVDAADVVGKASAPPSDGATEKDLAWFFKLYALRGSVDGVERMCFFTYLQKADDDAFDF